MFYTTLKSSKNHHIKCYGVIIHVQKHISKKIQKLTYTNAYMWTLTHAYTHTAIREHSHTQTDVYIRIDKNEPCYQHFKQENAQKCKSVPK